MSAIPLCSSGLQKLSTWWPPPWGLEDGRSEMPISHLYTYQQYEAVQEIKNSHGNLGITISRVTTQRHGINITDLNSNPSSDWGSICAPPQHTSPQSFPNSPKGDIFFLQMFGLIKSPNSSIEKGKTETWQSVPCNKDGLCIIQQVVQHGAYISLYIWSQITSENRTWMFLTILSFFSYLIDFWIQLKVFTYCGSEFHRLTICDIKGHFLYHFKIYCLLIELGILLCLFHKTG